MTKQEDNNQRELEICYMLEKDPNAQRHFARRIVRLENLLEDLPNRFKDLYQDLFIKISLSTERRSSNEKVTLSLYTALYTIAWLDKSCPEHGLNSAIEIAFNALSEFERQTCGGKGE